MERMKQRLFNARDRTQSSSYSHLILMTMEGGSLPQFLSLYNGVTKIKVRPYIEPVRQCFKCLRYGHLKDTCKRYKVCNNCGRAFHGECTEVTKCVNCGDRHKTINKSCLVFQKSVEIKKVMAEKNVSGFEAARLVRGMEQGVNASTEWLEQGNQEEQNDRWLAVESKKSKTVTYAEKASLGNKDRIINTKRRKRDTTDGNRDRDSREIDRNRTRREQIDKNMTDREHGYG